MQKETIYSVIESKLVLLLSGSISDQGLGMDAEQDPLFVNEESIV